MLVGTRQKLSFISANTLKLDDTTVPPSDSVSKASASSSTAHGPWGISLVQPPNPVTTRSIKLVLSGSIFPPTLQ